jgi:glycosyltransferase involved in cell wall biosynthesis
MERLTYLIANHNRGRYLPECIASLRRQTSPDWLAMIADDASTDDSLRIVAPLMEERIRLIVNARNLGYVGTLRRLIAEAETDVVAILDPDDALAPESTEILLRAYAENAPAGFVYSRFSVCDDALQSCRGPFGTGVPLGGSAMFDGVVGHILSFRRSVYERTAGLDEAMRFAEDRDLVYKLEEVTRPIFVDAVLYLYRELPDSQSHDPAKREIGALNTRRARRAALRRRRQRGLRRIAWEVYSLLDYLAYSDRRPGLKAAAAMMLRAAGVVARGMGRGLEPGRVAR